MQGIRILEEAFNELILAEDFWKESAQSDYCAKMAYHCQQEAIERLFMLTKSKETYLVYKNAIHSKEEGMKKLRSCPYGAKCDPSLWGDQMCQECKTKGL